MLSFLPEHLDSYVGAQATREDELLAELASVTRNETDLPQMMVGNIEGTLLRVLVRATQARCVLEVGTFTGYSALAMAAGLPDDAQLITCDVSEEYTVIARRFWERSAHGHKIFLRLGPALETIASLDAPIDMAFIDADKQNYVSYWDSIVPIVRTDGLIVADNVLWSGRVIDDPASQDEDTAALAAFNEHVRRDSRVEHVMLAIRDGITVAVKL